jgi:hypothetical protein
VPCHCRTDFGCFTAICCGVSCCSTSARIDSNSPNFIRNRSATRVHSGTTRRTNGEQHQWRRMRRGCTHSIRETRGRHGTDGNAATNRQEEMVGILVTHARKRLRNALTRPTGFRLPVTISIGVCLVTSLPPRCVSSYDRLLNSCFTDQRASKTAGNWRTRKHAKRHHPPSHRRRTISYGECECTCNSSAIDSDTRRSDVRPTGTTVNSPRDDAPSGRSLRRSRSARESHPPPTRKVVSVDWQCILVHARTCRHSRVDSGMLT